MRVADRLARREETWRELDLLLRRMEFRRLGRRARPEEIVWVESEADAARRREQARAPGAADVIRLGELYRAACADLMLAEAYDLPRETVAYLHALVARGHSAVYRARGFRFRAWAHALFVTVPRRLRADPTLKLAALAFWGPFILCALLAMARPPFAEQIVGADQVAMMEEMYAQPPAQMERDDAVMAGFYIQHNTTIGLQCFAWGLLMGLGSLFILLTQGIQLGAIFGHMAITPQAGHFYTFVTAHGPFELTAIVLSGAAGLRMGYGLIDTKGQTRLASLRREAIQALPTVGAVVVLFFLAAFLEGFVSASALPYPFKAGIAVACAAMLAAYLLLGGRGGTTAEAPASTAREATNRPGGAYNPGRPLP